MRSAEEQLEHAIGIGLRDVRNRRKLSLREVQELSEALAETYKHPELRISASWLNRAETGKFGLSALKLIALSSVYGLGPAELLALCSLRPEAAVPAYVPIPNATMLLHGGSLEDHAKRVISEAVLTASPPDNTMLLPREDDQLSRFRRGVVGRKDNTMEPMIQAGSIILIDIQKKTIAKRRDWTHEFNRPIYFMLTRESYHTGFCELDRDGMWLTLVPHALSYQTNRRWRYRKEVEVVGEIAGFVSRRF